MNRVEQIKICKECKHKASNLKQGIICGLTNDIQTFEVTCDQFEPVDQSFKEVAATIVHEDSFATHSGNYTEHHLDRSEPLKMVKSGANWFYWIAGLSLINSIMVYSGSNYSFILGLGFTQIVDGVVYELLGSSFSILGFVFNVIVIGIFVTFGFYANKFSKSAFIAGMIVYGLDALIFLLVGDWLGLGFHVFALFMIFKGFARLKEAKVALEQ
ncbi:MAG: hypothetical protein KDC79_07690 [Cyclobacteriaceae bacterium]|nr:hypothetical protein [Cyclobacteriaceae bacterium]